jgi:hypothetical protein
MKKVITLQNQHFLKKNYIYNFFRSSIKFNSFFLKNSFFLYKFYKLFNFFLFTNFFLKKKILYKKYSVTSLKSTNALFLKSKNNINNTNILYGQNYIDFNLNTSSSLGKQVSNVYANKNLDFLKYNYNNILNFNQFFNTLVLFKVK